MNKKQKASAWVISSGLNKSAFFLIALIAVLLSLGLIMVFDTTSAEVIDRSLELNPSHALIKQLAYALLSIGSIICLWKVGYQKMIGYAPLAYIGIVLLLVFVFIPGIGLELNGAKRWLGSRLFSLQPSEFFKVILPLIFIRLRRLPFYYTFFALTLPLGLIFLQPDNGTVAILLVTTVVLCFLTKVKWTYWALPLAILTFAGGFAASKMGHVHDRIYIYLNPESDLLGKGHQPYQAKIAAGSGGLLGRGVGQSLQKLNYLPEARSDYIAAIFAEEFGFLGVIFLLLLYMLIGYFGFTMGKNAPDIEGFYLSTIYTFLILFQAFLNLGVVCGLLPSKGTNLPFFSQGGSSLMANAMMLALILDVCRKKTCRKLS